MVEIDTDKIDDAVLALLYLTLHDGVRAWKGYDWDALDRLHRKGMLCDPVGKAKSVVLTDAGLAASERLFRKLFAKSTPMDGLGPESRDDYAAAAEGGWKFQGRSSSSRLIG